MEATPNWKRRSMNIIGQVIINAEYLDNENLKTAELQIVEKFLECLVDDLRRQAAKDAVENGDEAVSMAEPAPQRRRPTLSDEERERRRQRMREYWSRKRSETVSS